MGPIQSGDELLEARESLSMTLRQLAGALDISVSKIKKEQASATVSPVVALAVECLLRRRSTNNRVTPEERAERKFREKEHLRKLHEAAGLPMHGAGRPPRPSTETALRSVDLREERKRITSLYKRNQQRAEQRPKVALLHGRFSGFAKAGQWGLYRHALDAAKFETPTTEVYVLAYLDAAGYGPPDDDSPFVALPEETP